MSRTTDSDLSLGEHGLRFEVRKVGHVTEGVGAMVES